MFLSALRVINDTTWATLFCEGNKKEEASATGEGEAENEGARLS